MKGGYETVADIKDALIDALDENVELTHKLRGARTRLSALEERCGDVEGMTRGEFEKATRRALTLLDEWNEVTGFIPAGSSYQGEVEAIVRDAVDIGARAALGLNYMMVGKEGYDNDPYPDDRPLPAPPQE